MKKIIHFLFWIVSVSSYSQDYKVCEINFEDSTEYFRIEIDTVSYPNNIWQIGKPQKDVFTSADSPLNAIVTDTSDVYPNNDTSIFIINHISTGLLSNNFVNISFMYQVNSDSINDFGMIEFSPDNGMTWVNLLTDTLYLKQECYDWKFGKPILSGNSNGWVYMYAWVAGFEDAFNIQPGDTILYRFSFISDSIQTNKDGLMFDSFQFQDIGEGIGNLPVQFVSNVFPNPSSGIIFIEFENSNNDNHMLMIYNSQGQNILNMKLEKENIIQINMGDFNPDIYYYRLINQRNGKQSSGKIIRK